MDTQAHNQQMLTDYFAMIGRSLSDRIAAVWPNLTAAQRAEIEAETTEDGMRALLSGLGG